MASALVVVFHIARSRGGKVARHLLGADFAGFLTTDRWSAYEWVDPGQAQTDTFAAHRRGLRGPSLLPTAPVPQLALTA